MSTHRIAVVGDVHANYRALEAALSIASKTGYDELVFLGDVLTYGIDVAAVTETIASECVKKNRVLLRGNHDVIYLNPDADSTTDYIQKLPIWIRDSINFTKNKISFKAFNSLPFIDTYTSGNIFFSHANPFGKGDWRYLNSLQDHVEACDVLRRGNFHCGIFGHTHRTKLFASLPDPGLLIEECSDKFIIEEHYAPHIVNAGSIGQPRNESRQVYVIVIDVGSKHLIVDFKKISYDVAGHLGGIERSGLRPETVSKLISFFN